MRYSYIYYFARKSGPPPLELGSGFWPLGYLVVVCRGMPLGGPELPRLVECQVLLV
jgi:hypothetical protein